MPESARIETWDGTEVRVEPVRELSSGGLRVEIDAAGGGRWRLDMTKSGNYEVVTSWDETGQLADVPVPEWIDDVIARLQQV